jgi:hypothetical protein
MARIEIHTNLLWTRVGSQFVMGHLIEMVVVVFTSILVPIEDWTYVESKRRVRMGNDVKFVVRIDVALDKSVIV